MILIAPAQMGRGKHPLLFTDAFVLRRQAPTEVEAAARFFVSFMNSQAVQEMILMSGDVSPTAIPRYLLPATMSTFEAPRIKEDRFYQELKRAISVADPFPNTGFLNTRKALRDLLKTRLEQPWWIDVEGDRIASRWERHIGIIVKLAKIYLPQAVKFY
jgi:thiamine pyridinylase